MFSKPLIFLIKKRSYNITINYLFLKALMASELSHEPGVYVYL